VPDAWTLGRTEYWMRSVGATGPVLDVGTGEFHDWFRPLFESAGLRYVALDKQPLPGVEIVCDAGALTQIEEDAAGAYTTRPMIWKRAPAQFGTILLLSVLEHTPDPAQLTRWCAYHLAPGGHLFVAVPCCWPHHAFPDDYWRILPDGLRYLLRDLTLVSLEMETGDRLDVRNQIFAVARKPA
jgi:SAM-dependent methyltransferase